MELLVLGVPDCPNVTLLAQRLAEALDLHGRGDEVSIRHAVITNEAEASEHRMNGSPTLLVNGRDPFAVTGTRPSVSCGLYPGTDGKNHGAPSVPHLRAILAGDDL